MVHISSLLRDSVGAGLTVPGHRRNRHNALHANTHRCPKLFNKTNFHVPKGSEASDFAIVPPCYQENGALSISEDLSIMIEKKGLNLLN